MNKKGFCRRLNRNRYARRIFLWAVVGGGILGRLQWVHERRDTLNDLLLVLLWVLLLALLARWTVQLIFPEYGKLGRSLKPYSDGTVRTGIPALFDEIDSDMAACGRRFGRVWVGREWFVGDGVMRLDRIRAVFEVVSLSWDSKRSEYGIGLVDGRGCDLLTSVNRKKRRKALCRLLAERFPEADCGEISDFDWLDYVEAVRAENKNQ